MRIHLLKLGDCSSDGGGAVKHTKPILKCRMTSFPAWEFALSQQRAGTWQTGFSNKVSMLEGNCSCGYRESDNISIHSSSYSGWHEYMWGGLIS